MPVTVKNRFDQIARELEPMIKKRMKEGAELIVGSAKERVPVESGALRDAIHIDVEPEGVFIVAGDNKAFYGHMVEHGTTHSAPRPFLIPAGEAAWPEIQADIERALRRL